MRSFSLGALRILQQAFTVTKFSAFRSGRRLCGTPENWLYMDTEGAIHNR